MTEGPTPEGEWGSAWDDLWVDEPWDSPTGPSRGPLAWSFLRGLKTRVAATFGLLAGGLVAGLGFLVILAQRFPWYDNLAVLLGLLVAVPLSIAAIWASWGFGMRRRMRRVWQDGGFFPGGWED